MGRPPLGHVVLVRRAQRDVIQTHRARKKMDGEADRQSKERTGGRLRPMEVTPADTELPKRDACD